MKSNTLKILGLFLFVAMFFSSCKMTQVGMQNSDTQLQLRPFDLEISDTKTASASVTRVIGIDFSRLFKVDGANFSRNGIASGFMVPVLGAEIVSADQQYALRSLIEDHNGTGYDMVLYPKFQQKITSFIVFTKTETTVTARFAKLK